jgi:hypothetical protein
MLHLLFVIFFVLMLVGGFSDWCVKHSDPNDHTLAILVFVICALGFAGFLLAPKPDEAENFYETHPEIKIIAAKRWVAEGQKGDLATYRREFYAKPENRVPPPPRSRVELKFPRSLVAPGATRCVDGDLLVLDNYEIRFPLGRAGSSETGRLRIYYASFDIYDSEHCVVLETGYVPDPNHHHLGITIAHDLVSHYGMPECRVLPNAN